MFSDNKKKDKKRVYAQQQNRIADGTSMTGDIEAQGDFRIDGKLKGSLTTRGKIVIGKTGCIEGDLACKNADFHGKLQGSIVVEEHLSIKNTALIEGEVTTGKLAIEPGATLNGTCTMKGALKKLEDGEKEQKGKERKIEQTA